MSIFLQAYNARLQFLSVASCISFHILIYKLLLFLRFFFFRRRSISFSSSVGATDGMNTPPVSVTSTRLSIIEP